MNLFGTLTWFPLNSRQHSNITKTTNYITDSYLRIMFACKTVSDLTTFTDYYVIKTEYLFMCLMKCIKTISFLRNNNDFFLVITDRVHQLWNIKKT